MASLISQAMPSRRIIGNVRPRSSISLKVLDVDATLLETTESELLKLRLELESLRLQQRQILDTISHGVILLDQQDIITAYNAAALRLWNIAGSITGERIHDTDVAKTCPELIENVLRLRSSSEQSISFGCVLRSVDDDRTLAVLVRAARTGKDQLSLIIYCDDVSRQHELEAAVEQLESASRQLQSTNEQLQTTDQELQTLNQQLHFISTKLEERTGELEALKTCFAATLDLMPWPVLVLDQHRSVQLWNRELSKTFALSGQSLLGLEISKLPIPARLIAQITRGHTQVLKSKEALRFKVARLNLDSRVDDFEIRFTPVEAENGSGAVLVIIAGGAKRGHAAQRSETSHS